jgi:hypothetical protein
MLNWLRTPRNGGRVSRAHARLQPMVLCTCCLLGAYVRARGPRLRMNKRLWITNICGGLGLVVAIAEWIAPLFAIEVIIANIAGGIGATSGPDLG